MPSMRPGVAPTGGIPSRSARFRRGSRGPRVTPPDIPKIGVVEVDPNFKPRIELVPPTKPAERLGMDSAPVAPVPLDEAREERGGRGRGGGRGGRGRRGGGGGGEEAVSEVGARGERSGRSRRGGR